ncbi:MAG: hypothetical protein HRU11_11435, partial [Parvularculaceae bacterium]|nr:hypothetical protein [Parvularculaceae bacterium]
MKRFLATTSLTALLLAACGQSDNATVDETPAPPAEETIELPGVPQVEIAITLGTFDGDVTDLAAIEARPLGFQGRIMVPNGLAGVQMVQVDGTFLGILSPVTRAENKAATLVASSYAFGDKPLALQFVPEADGLSRVELLILDDPTSQPVRSWSLDEKLLDLCVTQGVGAVVTTRGRVARFDVSPDVPQGRPIRIADGLEGEQRCHATKSHLLIDNGSELVDVLGEEPVVVEGVPSGADGYAETAEGLVAVSIEAGQLMVAGKPVQLVNGRGIVILPASILVEGGNFGGILRDGMVAVLDENQKLHL